MENKPHTKKIIVLILLLLSFINIPISAQTATIRLAWQEREHFNPLNTFDESGKAVMDLVYRGLFMIDDRGVLRKDLIAEASWSQDYYSLNISLRRDESFSNKKRLTARDVALSILYYRYYFEAYLAAHIEDNLTTNYENSDTTNGEEFDVLENTGVRDNYSPLQFLTEGRTGEYATGDGGLTNGSTNLNAENQQDNAEDPESGENSGKSTEFSVNEQTMYFNQLETDPIGQASLRAISSINVIDDYNLEIILSERDARLPWVLTLPIIPEEYMEHLNTTESIPGIGPYTITVNEKYIELVPSFTGEKSTNLRVYSFKNFNQALEAFTQGNIEVLYTPKEVFHNLTVRQGLQTIPQETLDYYFLICGTSPDYLFSSDEIRVAFRKSLSQSPQGSFINDDVPYPLHQRDWRREFLIPVNKSDNWGEEWQVFKKNIEGQTISLAAISNVYNREIIAKIKQTFISVGANPVITWLEEQEFASFVERGEYDLLLGNIELSFPCDWRTLRVELGKISERYIAYFPQVGSEDLLSPGYFYQWDVAQDQPSFQSMQDVYTNLQVNFQSTPVFELFFAKQGLLLSPKIKGLINPPAWAPYRSIEDLELWD